MPKLYEQYLKLKKENPNVLYLFKSGLFYIALEDDALLLSEKLHLKLTNFGNATLKCGFPESRLNYYVEHFKLQNINYILIKPDVKQKNDTVQKATTSNFSLSKNQAISQILFEIATLDINNITLKNSFDKLYDFHIKAKKILNTKE